MTRPDDIIEWASSGTKTAPSSTRRAQGWQGGDIPPAEQQNKILSELTLWLEYLRGAGTHTALGDAYDDLDAGETAIINEYDGTVNPGALRATGSALTGAYRCISTGRYLIVSTNTTVGTVLAAYDRDNITAAPTAITTTIVSSAITGLACNGAYLVIIAGNQAECFSVGGSWTQQWTYNHGAALSGVAIDADNVYIGGASGTGSRRVRAITLSSGSAAWSIDHGADVVALAADGRRCIIAAAPSSYATGANVRAVNASNGYDATGECAGGGTDTAGVAWDQLTDGDPVSVVTDGRRLFLGYDETVHAAGVEARETFNGELVADVKLDGSAYAFDLDVDHEYVAVGTHTDPSGTPVEGYVWLLRKDTLQPVWRFTNTDTTHKAVYGVACDGAGVFVCLEHSGSRVRSLTRGNRPTIFRKLSSDDIGRGYDRILVAQEAR